MVSIKVLMLGWEFPPYKSGGLGTACFDLTKGLANNNVEVTFIMPYAPENAAADFVHLVGANNITNIKITTVKTLLQPYMTTSEYSITYKTYLANNKKGELYGANMHAEIQRYNEAVRVIAESEEFDIIHAHDWMTYGAGMIAKQISGKPLVVHIHNTVFNRYLGNTNQYEYDIEKRGFMNADKIIAISNYIQKTLIQEYDIDHSKIAVVHWGISTDNPYYKLNYRSEINKRDKVVLFLGRITVQKGPEYFVHAARKTVDFISNVKFVVVGKGDKMPEMIQQVADLGLSNKFIFAGWLKGAEVHRAFQMADLFVMPSVSEPFGLVPLEASMNGAPVIISKQSGVAEVMQHALKIDFWDVNELANKIVNVLRYDCLHKELQQNSYMEVSALNLNTPARKCIDIYNTVLK